MQVLPKISIITPNYNRVSSIERTIRSVLFQRYQNFEYIIIDGGSNDGSVDIIGKYSQQLEYWTSEPDNGIYHAFNKGIAKASGEWIYFLGSDDFLWNENVLSTVWPTLQDALPDYPVVYGNIHVVDSYGRIIRKIGAEFEKRKFFQMMTVPHQGLFQHRSLFSKIGLFNQNFKSVGDYEWLLRCFKKFKPKYLENLVVAGMLDGGTGSHARYLITRIVEHRAARKLNNIKGLPIAFYKMVIKTAILYLLYIVVGRERINYLLAQKDGQSHTKSK